MPRTLQIPGDTQNQINENYQTLLVTLDRIEKNELTIINFEKFEDDGLLCLRIHVNKNVEAFEWWWIDIDSLLLRMLQVPNAQLVFIRAMRKVLEASIAEDAG